MKRLALALGLLGAGACDSHLIVGAGSVQDAQGGGGDGAQAGGASTAGGSAGEPEPGGGAAGEQAAGAPAGGGAAGAAGGGGAADELPTCPTAITALDVSAGWDHACAVTTDHEIYCWGGGQSGQLGNGYSMDSPTPVKVLSDETFETVVAMDTTTCALTSAGELFCWGSNFDGVLATDAVTASNVPISVLNGVQGFDGAAGNVVAFTDDAQVHSWGSNTYGQLGLGPDTVGSTVREVTEVPGRTASDTAAGGHHLCVLDLDGQPRCAGDNLYGQLGRDVESGDTFEPADGGRQFESIDAGYELSCGLTSDGSIYCWGRNEPVIMPDWLGVISAPRRLGSSAGWTALSLGMRHLCAIREQRLFCVGGNDYGELGHGGDADGELREISGGAAYLDVSAGRYFTCAIRGADSVVVCFGSNGLGQLGRAGADDFVPTPVCRAP